MTRATPVAVTRCVVIRDARYPAISAIKMTMPPIVGVPIFSMWVCGPSSRIRWPQPQELNAWIATGVPSNATASAAPAAIRIEIT
jgi:hypothetical protein